jgi:hypothetical protein
MIGALIAGAASAATAILTFVVDESVRIFKACGREPRAFFAIGLALIVGNWHGFHTGYTQGKGDLDTYRQSAEVLQKQADDLMEQAIAARDKAGKVRRPKQLAPAKSQPSVLDTITGALR